MTMTRREWTGPVAATFLIGLLGVAALPSPYAGLTMDVRQPVYRGNLRTRESKSDLETEVVVKSDISVVDSSDDGRSNMKIVTTPTPMSESLKMVTKQLLQAPSATDMVATDVRTPPRVKSQQKQPIIEQAEFVPLGKGEAVPVVDGPSSYQTLTTTPLPKISTPSSGGLSTWILLSNGEQSTQPNKKKPTVLPTVDPKKNKVDKNTKNEDIKKNVVKKNVTKEEVPKISSIILQDSKFKNRTPVVVGRIPAVQSNKTETTTKRITTTQPTTIFKRRPTQPTPHLPDIVPTTSLVIQSDLITNETSTEASSTTTKKTRRTSTKKKKKNKNRRRRPTKDSDTAESKIQEVAVGSKIDINRPISTRIYNYLAREVMPSVGVGIVGLVLTAGLAGLFLYPFGGGIARRNYEKGTGQDHNMYYYNNYSPHHEKESPNAQPEEKVFGQVLSSMSQSAYSQPFDNKYTTSNNNYRYDMHDYSVNGYANDYSTIPESVKNDYKTTEYKDSYSPPDKDYTADTKSDYLPEASKYYSMDPLSSHYKLTDISPEVNYPSLTEYTSYTNAASVGTSEDENNKTETIYEDKSDKSQPQFSALVGSPQFTNTDFVGSVSLKGSYGTHRSGVLSDPGPRSMRSKRDVHDDFSNEIDTVFKPLTSEEPTTVKEETTEEIVTEPSETTTEEFKVPTSVDAQSNSGFFGFLSKLAQIKLQLGISLLRTTGEAFQRYLNNMATRMEAAVRTMETRRIGKQHRGN